MSTLVEKSEAVAVEVACSHDALSATLSDGRVVSVPLVWFPRLADATPQERSGWELIGGGIGIHWEAIDEDILVASLLRPERYEAAGRGDAARGEGAANAVDQVSTSLPFQQQARVWWLNG
jgi:hypothetical protein